jgi:protein-L-isoaspartate(D-aspartate) O-methyltransferase
MNQTTRSSRRGAAAARRTRRSTIRRTAAPASLIRFRHSCQSSSSSILVLVVVLLLHVTLLCSIIATNETEAYLPSDNNNNNNNRSIMRAWNCHGRNQRDMVDRLRQANIVRTEAVQRVMNQVDRQYYCPIGTPSSMFYQDSPLSIGLGQTISAPHMHAHVLEEMVPYLVAPAAGKDVEGPDDDLPPVALLDVGCGSGYLTACMGRWLHPKSSSSSATPTSTTAAKSILGRHGKVYGIDVHRDLVERTRANMERAGDDDLLSNGVVTLQAANGWLGLPEAAPFDAIHVGAAAHAFPAVLAQQLKVGGVLIVPIGPQSGTQALYKVERVKGDDKATKFDATDYKLTELLGVRYVPLVDRPPS